MKAGCVITITHAVALLLVSPICATANADECTIREDGLVLHSGRTWPGVWWPACGPFPVSDYDSANVSACESNPSGQRRIFLSSTNAMIVVNQGVDLGNLCAGKLRSGWSQVAVRPGEGGGRECGRGDDPNLPVSITLVEIRETLNGLLGANIRGCAKDPEHADRLFVKTTNCSTRIVKNEPYAREECARLGFALPLPAAPQAGSQQQIVTPPSPPTAHFVPQQLPTSCVARQYRGNDPQLQINYVDLINQCNTSVRIAWQSFDNGSPQMGAGAGVGHSGCIKPGGTVSTTLRPTVGVTSENKAVSVVTCQ